MEREAYRSMRLMQREHWWFVGRRRVLEALLRSLALPEPARILEAGAGSGGNVPLLRGHGEVSAFDMDAEAAGFCQEDTGVACAIGSLPDANPFQGKAIFDLVVALDVIEHIEQDVASVRSLGQCLAPGGRMLLTVPAYPWLFSGHDRFHHHRRRYTRRGLEQMVAQAGLRVHRSGHFNALLLPAAIAVRLAQRLFGREADSDLRMPGRRLNALLAAMFASEARVLPRLSLPVGLSLFVVAGAD